MVLVQRISIRHWQLLAVLVILVVWAGSLWPDFDLDSVSIPQGDKLLHFLAYVAIAYLLARGWPRWPLWLVWLVAILCGGAAEIGQAVFTDTRRPDWLDMLANGGGAMLGALAGMLTFRRARDRRQ